MKIKTLTVTLGILLALSGITHATCPDGNFIAKGWNPGADQNAKESYTGKATIKAVGDVCQMDWMIGTQAFTGVGAYDPTSKILNIAYADLKNGWFGMVWYLDKGTTLEGKWVVAGTKDGKLGKEILTRQ